MIDIVSIPFISIHALHTLQKDMIHFMSKYCSANYHVILLANLPPTITFGANASMNRFTSKVEKKLRSLNLKNNYQLPPSDKLIMEGVNGLSFFQSSRGGGSTYLGPGQRVVFFNFCADTMYGQENQIGKHSLIVDTVMTKTLSEILKPWLAQNQNAIYIQPKKDILVSQDNIESKIGSKGLGLFRVNGRYYTHFGGSFHVQDEGLQGFEHVYPCGFSDLPTTSCESLLERTVTLEEFDSYFISQVQGVQSARSPDDPRNKMQKNVEAYLGNKQLQENYRS